MYAERTSRQNGEPPRLLSPLRRTDIRVLKAHLFRVLDASTIQVSGQYCALEHLEDLRLRLLCAHGIGAASYAVVRKANPD